MKYKKQSELFSPMLNILNVEKHLSIDEIISQLAQHFNLDDHFLNQRYEVTNQLIFKNQVQWKINDLNHSGLIEFIKIGNKRFFRISEQGKSFLNSTNKNIRKVINERYRKKLKAEKQENSKELLENMDLQIETEINPLEQLEKSYVAIRQQVYDDILDAILSKSPKAFENLVTQLLQKMGYGDGEVTQISRDGGIDARIKGDVLGFEQIYVQAKRYQRDTIIGRSEIQGFTGALFGLEGNATKGVFITTARFSQDAKIFAQHFSKARIVLIDGSQLAKYCYDYELGVQKEKVFSIKKLDNDFWESVEE